MRTTTIGPALAALAHAASLGAACGDDDDGGAAPSHDHDYVWSTRLVPDADALEAIVAAQGHEMHESEAVKSDEVRAELEGAGHAGH
jgi:hypothetical protein